jgi:Cu-Zn family superoxide dismutase
MNDHSNPILRVLLAVAIALPGVSFAKTAKPAPIKVEIKNAQGVSIGTADLTPAKKGVQVKLHLTQLAPGTHGIHFHEKGTCDGPDFKSAGSHFNPAGKEHGLENPKGAHAGDMPNIEASRSGTVNTTFVAHGVTMGAGDKSIRRPGGAALVVHAKADDQKSNPAGDSGDRVACGVIAAVGTAAAQP